MILVRAPLRISLSGGGTDLPAFYDRYGAHFIAAAIDKYVYIAINPTFNKDIILKYSSSERVTNVEDIKHPLFREALRHTGVSGVEITSFSDIPGGTGLGSSGAFLVALLHALYLYKDIILDKKTLAHKACEIEINKLNLPVGIQDQYSSAFGGMYKHQVDKQNHLITNNFLDIGAQAVLEDSCLLYFTRTIRSAPKILSNQVELLNKDDKVTIQNLKNVKSLSKKMETAIIAQDMPAYGNLLSRHWNYKKRRSKDSTTPLIDYYYNLAMKNGALGGKLIGAGGGGFLLFITQEKDKLRKVLSNTNLLEIPFRFSYNGVEELLNV